ncbi:hypothetical protein TWF106_005028 [Orbilia oligospora]|uniref:Uncharacterized protein n=1 Tax=Orbilia oligospora TaxID=2813651 RepID=A0A7C8Q518_ORBOL|nr:hypothetical protein TWF106_005028 [Orbilia oligospora]
MSSKDRYTGESSRSTYPSRRSYDYSESESSDDTSSLSSESDYHHNPQRKRRSSSARRQYTSDRLKGLTKAPQNQPVRRRRAASESRARSKRHFNSDSSSQGDTSSESDSESDDSSLEENSSGRRSKGDMSVASSSYHKRPKTKLEKKVDEVLDAFGLLHIKNNPSKRQLSSPDPEKYTKQKQALQAAVTAAAIEAWRSHSKPGGFNLQKIIRVLVAGIAAGGVDVLVENRPGHDKMRDIAEAVVGGLATSKTLGGKITHRREGGAQGTMIDGFIALAASKMVKPPKKDEIEWRKKKYAKRSRSMEPSTQKQSSPRKR